MAQAAGRESPLRPGAFGLPARPPGSRPRVSNIQQPEMRRSGHDPLVQDSVKDTPRDSKGGSSDRTGRSVPPDQQSPYGPSGRSKETERKSNDPEEGSDEA